VDSLSCLHNLQVCYQGLNREITLQGMRSQMSTEWRGCGLPFLPPQSPGLLPGPTQRNNSTAHGQLSVYSAERVDSLSCLYNLQVCYQSVKIYNSTAHAQLNVYCPERVWTPFPASTIYRSVTRA
jgi:hypothetical protein